MSEENTIDLSGDKGVTKEIIQEGNGEELPPLGCKVALHYTGSLVDGTVFDSSVGREPFEFDLGKGRVIKAFELGVKSMKLNEKCKITCAPEYAYGAAGVPPNIPPNATLIFEMELLQWIGEDVSPNADGAIERIIVEESARKRSPKSGALITVHLTGKYNGVVFEERELSYDYGEDADVGVIEGVEIGLAKMVIGETSRFIIKSKYAFGKEGNEAFGIPPEATVEYIVKLINCEKAIEEWVLTAEEKIQHAGIYKDKGTRYFNKANYVLALKMYKKALELLKADDSNKIEEFQKLKVAAYGNIALCHQKLNQHFEAKVACDEVLKIDSSNIKALYRRGQCSLTTNDFKEALNDLNKVIELEPNNKAAYNLIQICKQRQKVSLEKERKTYANMFTKFATAANREETSTNEPDVLATCGEWTDEDAIREVDMAFERDNNIVMI